MEATIQVGKGGILTLPAELQMKYGIRPGDVLHLVDLDGVLVLTPDDGGGSNRPSYSGNPPTIELEELTQLGEEIGRGWRSSLTSAELCSEMRR